jgi:DNA polymerase III delta prime subunit
MTEKMITSTNNLLKFITNSKGVSHSFILSGEKGMSTAKQLACKLLKTDNITSSPNILWLDTEKKISVDEIRNIGEFMYKTTYHSDLPKLIVITCIDNLNITSMNALLKLLEEPTKNTYFISLSHNIEILPDTIRSRSIVINLSPLDPPTTRKIIEEQFPDISDPELDEYFSISSQQDIISELINNDALKIYGQLLDFLQLPPTLASTKLYKFIEKKFSTLEQLEIFQTLIIKVLRSANNIEKLLLIEKEMGYLISNAKTFGLDVKTVVLIMLCKIRALRIVS